MSDYFYNTKEAKRIGDNCLFYQGLVGGFPKDVYIPEKITQYARIEDENKKDNVSYCSIDNGATVTEIDYLAKLYNHTKNKRYKEGAEDGIRYLLLTQLDNGGWKQCYPHSPKLMYQLNITFNDNAIVNVLKLLRKVANKSYPYEFIDDETATMAQKAFDKGIECILKTQIVQNGKKTAWCAQYDSKTLQPSKGRNYEYPSLSGGRESVGILLLLMSIENPSEEIINSVKSGVEWFNKSKIEELRAEYFMDNKGHKDYKMIKCKDCPPIWARCYELNSNKPIFSSRKGEKYVYDIREVSQARRNGYEWYSSEGLEVFRTYEDWKIKFNKH